MIVDLHAHYPMHVVPDGKVKLWRLLTSACELRRLRDRVRAALIGLASRFGNHASFHAGPRVRAKYMKRGGVGVALSVLYSFFDEVDVLGGATPRAGYLQTIEDQLDAVRELEAHIERIHAITGSHRHTAIGSDFDGFIKPTLPGLRDMRDMRRLERELWRRYPEDAESICSENALRPFQDYWGGTPEETP